MSIARPRWCVAVFSLLVLVVAVMVGSSRSTEAAGSQVHRMIVVPEEDRFAPFALTIRVGDTVEWVNQDTDDHTVVSDDAFNTTNRRGVDHLLLGTDRNGGQPGTFRLRFTKPGTFVYYCRFHAQLDSDHQPVAPGPRGGIQDASGNFGTPMMGVITVMEEGE